MKYRNSASPRNYAGARMPELASVLKLDTESKEHEHGGGDDGGPPPDPIDCEDCGNKTWLAYETGHLICPVCRNILTPMIDWRTSE